MLILYHSQSKSYHKFSLINLIYPNSSKIIVVFAENLDIETRDAPEFRSGRNSGPELEKKSGPVPAGIIKKAGPEPEFWLKFQEKLQKSLVTLSFYHISSLNMMNFHYLLYS